MNSSRMSARRRDVLYVLEEASVHVQHAKTSRRAFRKEDPHTRPEVDDKTASHVRESIVLLTEVLESLGFEREARNLRTKIER